MTNLSRQISSIISFTALALELVFLLCRSSRIHGPLIFTDKKLLQLPSASIQNSRRETTQIFSSKFPNSSLLVRKCMPPREIRCLAFSFLSSVSKPVSSCSMMNKAASSLDLWSFTKLPAICVAKTRRFRQCSDFQPLIRRFSTKLVSGTDRDWSARLVTGHVFPPCLNHSSMAVLSKVCPDSSVTGSLNKWPVKGHMNSFGMLEKKDPWSIPSWHPNGSVLRNNSRNQVLKRNTSSQQHEEYILYPEFVVDATAFFFTPFFVPLDCCTQKRKHATKN